MAKGKEDTRVLPESGPTPDLLRIIEKEDAPYPEQITFNFPDFTSVCPITGQPDRARMLVRYVPADKFIEKTSLRLYLRSFRYHGGFNEAIVNRILDDLVTACAPEEMTVRGEFTSRGGVQLTVEACHPA